MGNKLTTIITTVVILIVFMMLTAFLAADTQLDQAKQTVRSLTETVQYKGYITADQYNHAISEIPYKNMRLNITHIKRDNYKNGIDSGYLDGTLDMEFTSQVLKDVVTDRIHKFQIGDEVQIDLMVMDGTFFDAISSMVMGSPSSAVKMITSESGVILNEKYEVTGP